MKREGKVRFSELPVGRVFQAGSELYLKIRMRFTDKRPLPQQPANARCLTGERAGHHITFGKNIAVTPVRLDFTLRQTAKPTIRK